MLQVLLGGKRRRQPRSQRVAERLLGWSLPLNVGLMGILFFLGHTVRAKETAEQLGWPADNPFQTEVAFASLSFGTLGLVCARCCAPASVGRSGRPPPWGTRSLC